MERSGTLEMPSTQQMHRTMRQQLWLHGHLPYEYGYGMYIQASTKREVMRLLLRILQVMNRQPLASDVHVMIRQV